MDRNAPAKWCALRTRAPAHTLCAPLQKWACFSGICAPATSRVWAPRGSASTRTTSPNRAPTSEFRPRGNTLKLSAQARLATGTVWPDSFARRSEALTRPPRAPPQNRVCLDSARDASTSRGWAPRGSLSTMPSPSYLPPTFRNRPRANIPKSRARAPVSVGIALAKPFWRRCAALTRPCRARPRK